MKFSNKVTKLVKWILVPILLFFLWAGLTLNFINDHGGFTLLNKNHNKESFSSFNTSKLKKGQKASALFTASENNLGIVAVRFNTFNRINDDKVIFRIKERGQNNWYYENSYSVDQFQPNDLFTFGFMPITNSSGKVYEFQIESAQGTNQDAVAISPLKPVFVSKYQFTKQELMTSPTKAAEFISKKIVNSVTDTEFLISSLIYLLPLILYLAWLLFFDKYLADKYFVVLIPIILLILASIFLNEISQLILIVGVLIWIFILLAYKLESRISFLGAILFLLTTAVAIIFNLSIIAQNASLWVYMFLVIGAFQQVIEIKYGAKGLISYNVFLQKLRGR